MQTIEILYNRNPTHSRSIRLSTRLTYLEVLRQLGQHSALGDHWLHIRSRLGAWITSDILPTIIVRGEGITAGPDDTVELWWNGGVLECYRLEELATMFKVEP